MEKIEKDAAHESQLRSQQLLPCYGIGGILLAFVCLIPRTYVPNGTHLKLMHFLVFFFHWDLTWSATHLPQIMHTKSEKVIDTEHNDKNV